MDLTVNLKKNEEMLRSAFVRCDDIKFKSMQVGTNRGRECLLIYIEVSVSNLLLDNTALGQLFQYLNTLPEDRVIQALKANAPGISDVNVYQTLQEAQNGLLTGAAILLVDGFKGALKISDKGYPGMDVQKGSTEKVIRGSEESFSESEKINTALIRKRLRSPNLKVEEQQLGLRSKTNVALVYMEDLANEGVLKTIKERLVAYEIDGVLDSGILEQLAEKQWYSFFPQFLTTRRPDRAAMAILEGKIVVISDNSPEVLVLPTDFNAFLKTTDDYYNRFQMATFGRLLRYVATFIALCLPGLYLAVTNFHTQILPTKLLLSFQEARIGVPFPAALEILLMELAFEMLREAGVRLPGTMGNTIGIVGGLIIGQSAVEAGLVSPIIVIVVAFTALCSFAIPSEEFAFAFRVLKFIVLALSAWLGFFGFLLALYGCLIHLAGLKSFGMPFLTPFVGPELNGNQETKDAMVRFPLRLLWKRPLTANPNQRRKLRRKRE